MQQTSCVQEEKRFMRGDPAEYLATEKAHGVMSCSSASSTPPPAVSISDDISVRLASAPPPPSSGRSGMVAGGDRRWPHAAGVSQTRFATACEREERSEVWDANSKRQGKNWAREETFV
nr:unnamed protein product [Digitaria exilis]